MACFVNCECATSPNFLNLMQQQGKIQYKNDKNQFYFYEEYDRQASDKEDDERCYHCQQERIQKYASYYCEVRRRNQNSEIRDRLKRFTKWPYVIGIGWDCFIGIVCDGSPALHGTFAIEFGSLFDYELFDHDIAFRMQF